MPEKERGLETLEKGNLYFFYRPRVEEEDPDAKSDLQRLSSFSTPRHRRRGTG